TKQERGRLDLAPVPPRKREFRQALHLILFFFNDTPTPEIYTLSLHDALPIRPGPPVRPGPLSVRPGPQPARPAGRRGGPRFHRARIPPPPAGAPTVPAAPAAPSRRCWRRAGAPARTSAPAAAGGTSSPASGSARR